MLRPSRPADPGGEQCGRSPIRDPDLDPRTAYVPVVKISFNGSNGAPKSTNGVEQCQWSPRTGLFYITVPGIEDPNTGEGVVAVISPQSSDGRNVFPIPLAKCDTPQGMAIGPTHDILIGCNGSRLDDPIVGHHRRAKWQYPRYRGQRVRVPTRCGLIPATTTTSWRARSRAPQSPRLPHWPASARHHRRRNPGRRYGH